MASSAKPKSRRNRLFLWVGAAFLIQILAWCFLVWVSQKANHDEVPLQHRQPATF